MIKINLENSEEILANHIEKVQDYIDYNALQNRERIYIKKNIEYILKAKPDEFENIILKIKVKWEHTFARLLQARCHRKWHRTGWIFSIRHIVQGWMIMAMRVHRRQIPCFRLQGLSGIYLQ